MGGGPYNERRVIQRLHFETRNESLVATRFRSTGVNIERGNRIQTRRFEARDRRENRSNGKFDRVRRRQRRRDDGRARPMQFDVHAEIRRSSTSSQVRRPTGTLRSRRRTVARRSLPGAIRSRFQPDGQVELKNDN